MLVLGSGGEGWIRTSVRLRGQIYSLLPLTTRPPLQARHEGLSCQLGHGAALLKVSDVASYCVTGGSEIVVQPEAGAAEQNIRLFLLGSAMGLVLHQRRLLPLHANAVEIRGKAVAFMGASGEGKSSLAAWFHDHHFQIIADDVCVVRFGSGGQPVASPGVPRLRLSKEVLEATGRQAADYERSYAGDEGFEKYDVPVAAYAVATDELQLGAVYLLGRGKQFLIQQLHGVGAVEAVIANTYRGSFISVVGDARAHFEACLKLVDRTPVFEVFWTWDFPATRKRCARFLLTQRELSDRRQGRLLRTSVRFPEDSVRFRRRICRS